MAVSFRIPAFAACTLLLAACAGGHGTGGFTPAALPQSDAAFEPDAGAQTVPMKYSIKIPPAKPNASAALRHEQFVSASTQSIAFAVYKAGSKHSAKTLLFTKVIALNAGAKGCTNAKTRTCSGTLNLPPPAVDIVATTYDLKPAGKKISKKAKALAVATIAGQAVQANKKIAITLGGIPASFTMTIPGSTIVNGAQTASVYGMSQSSSNISVKAFDADGNFIVSDGYVDANGKSTGIAMSEKPSWASCTTPVLQDGTATPGASIVVSAPPKDGVFFNYGIGGIAAPFSTAGYCSFAVSARLGKGPIQKGSYVLDGPQLNEYPISSMSAPTAIVVGPDNNIWFADGSSVGTINVATKTISPSFQSEAARQPSPLTPAACGSTATAASCKCRPPVPWSTTSPKRLHQPQPTNGDWTRRKLLVYRNASAERCQGFADRRGHGVSRRREGLSSRYDFRLPATSGSPDVSVRK